MTDFLLTDNLFPPMFLYSFIIFNFQDYLKKVSFPFGKEIVQFDASGDPPGKKFNSEILSLEWKSFGTIITLQSQGQMHFLNRFKI